MRPARAILLGVIAALAVAACDALPFAPAGPLGDPQVVCQGVPRAACQLAADSLAPDVRPVRVVVRCTLPVCTEAEGDAEVTIQFADGRSEVSGYGWTTAPEPAPQDSPEPPVPEGS